MLTDQHSLKLTVSDELIPPDAPLLFPRPAQLFDFLRDEVSTKQKTAIGNGAQCAIYKP